MTVNLKVFLSLSEYQVQKNSSKKPGRDVMNENSMALKTRANTMEVLFLVEQLQISWN